jgi:hypothetical protein
VLTAFTLGLRLVRLGDLGLWYDEAFGLLIARMPWGEMNRTILLDVHPPLWFWLLHLWGTDSVLWARLFGVLLGAATVPAVWLAARRAVGEASALTAAGLLALHPIHVFYSQELRMYALQGLLLAALIGVALRLLRRGPSVRRWAALSLLAWSALATQHLGAAVVGGVWVGLFAASWFQIGRRWLLGWLLSGTAALAGVLPWLMTAEWHMVAGQRSSAPLGQRVLLDLVEGTQGIVRATPWEWVGIPGGRLLWAMTWSALLLALIVSGARRLIADPERRRAGVFLAATVLFSVLFLISYEATGFLFFTRYCVILAVPSVILMGVALMRGPVWWRVAATSLVVVMYLSHTAAVLRTEVREVSTRLHHWIDERGGPDQAPPILVTNAFIALPMRALLPGHDVRLIDRPTETTNAQRAILGSEALVLQWPEEWGDGPIWLLLQAWGNPPFDRSRGFPRPDSTEITRRALAEMEALGHHPESVQLLRFEAITGGFKWAALVEVR